MLVNAGRVETDINRILFEVTTGPLGYNVKTEYFEDLIETGVIDPTKVTKNAIRNSISVASTILSTNCIITESDGSTK
jgi:chaperonin GroEL